MEYNSMIKKTDKQKKARAKGRKHKKHKLGQIVHLALKSIPDEVLEKFGWGVGEDCEDMDLCCWDDEDSIDAYQNNVEKYPQILDIGKLIQNVVKSNHMIDSHNEEECEQFYEMDEPIDSEYKFKESR